jgi:hypothetical protein
MFCELLHHSERYRPTGKIRIRLAVGGAPVAMKRSALNLSTNL